MLDSKGVASLIILFLTGVEPCDNPTMWPVLLDYPGHSLPRLFTNTWPCPGHASEVYLGDENKSRYVWGRALEHSTENWVAYVDSPICPEELSSNHHRLVSVDNLPCFAGQWLDLSRCNECNRPKTSRTSIVTNCQRPAAPPS